MGDLKMQRVLNLLFLQSARPDHDFIMSRLKARLPKFQDQVKVYSIPELKEEHLLALGPQVLSEINAGVINHQKDAVRLAIKHLPNLRWLNCIFTGLDSLLSPDICDLIEKSNVTLTNARRASSIPLAEFSITSCLYFAKKIPQFDEWKRRKEWTYTTVDDITKKTILIVGVGEIGLETARMAKQGFRMRVLGIRRRFLDQTLPNVDLVGGYAELEKWLPEADYVVNCLPLTAETRNLFKWEHFTLMKRSAVFVNVGRGTTVDEEALIRALREDIIAGAGLDVFSQEPLPIESPFYNDPKVREKTFMTFHTIDETTIAQEESANVFEDNLDRYISGKPLTNIVDLRSGY
eukprot:TRINITY_DN1278_c0_g1_i2.p1 TRINITY_DN1278_c0_g1~~TRINITY_DN1278_c0_g1_i2.p1  ORF type:complete len:349 (+),score=56.12 TRINITY_DN1278_c0_g1_i2:93-1139(+)